MPGPETPDQSIQCRREAHPLHRIRAELLAQGANLVDGLAEVPLACFELPRDLGRFRFRLQPKAVHLETDGTENLADLVVQVSRDPLSLAQLLFDNGR